MDTVLWPVAARHAVELERRRLEKITEKIPRFGQRVVTRKRAWKRKDEFDTTSEEVTYLIPVPEVSKGHAVLTGDNKFKVVSYVLKDLLSPEVGESRWEAIEAEAIDLEPMEVRRRLREKTSMSTLSLMEEKQVKERVLVNKILREEEQNLATDDPDIVPACVKGLVSLRQEQVALADRPDEDEVLQTKIVQNHLVWDQQTEWLPCIKNEIDSLMQKALKRLSPTQMKRLRQEHEGPIEVVPGKALRSVKALDGRR